LKRRLTRQTAGDILAGLDRLVDKSLLQREDSRQFAVEIRGRFRLLLSGDGDLLDTDWEASDWGDLAYLLGSRRALGLRELAARIDSGKRKIGCSKNTLQES
jgi:hypothetical protein